MLIDPSNPENHDKQELDVYEFNACYVPRKTFNKYNISINSNKQDTISTERSFAKRASSFPEPPSKKKRNVGLFPSDAFHDDALATKASFKNIEYVNKNCLFKNKTF